MLPPPSTNDQALFVWQQEVARLLSELAKGQAGMYTAIELLTNKLTDHIGDTQKKFDELDEKEKNKPRAFRGWSNWVFGCAGMLFASIVTFSTVVGLIFTIATFLK